MEKKICGSPDSNRGCRGHNAKYWPLYYCRSLHIMLKLRGVFKPQAVCADFIPLCPGRRWFELTIARMLIVVKRTLRHPARSGCQTIRMISYLRFNYRSWSSFIRTYVICWRMISIIDECVLNRPMRVAWEIVDHIQRLQDSYSLGNSNSRVRQWDWHQYRHKQMLP